MLFRRIFKFMSEVVQSMTAILYRRVLSVGGRRFWQLSLTLSASTGNSYDRNSNGLDLMSVRQKWIQKYKSSDIPDPIQSAELIIAHALGKKMIREIPEFTKINKQSRNLIDELCSQRLERKPVQYIIGEWDFMDLTLVMRPPVLIPRPETEELCELVLKEFLQSGTDGQPVKFLDIGCGSGAISLYLLKHLPQATCVGVDMNSGACDLTLENAKRLELSGRISILQGDITQDSLLNELLDKGPFDIMISNPPYIPTSDMEQLMPEVQRFESHEALHGGEEGMDIIIKILDVARRLLKNRGLLWLETDTRHASKIREMVTGHQELNLEFVGAYNDFTERPRFCKLIRRPVSR